MSREEIVLAALSAGGKGAWYEPVQVQKLFFLIDREISQLIGGRHFNFQAYDYGPYDSAVYATLEGLHSKGLVAFMHGYYREYGLTDAGFDRGAAVLQSMNASAREYISKAAAWVRSLSFSQLVSAIYEKYPDMKEKSVFRSE